MNEACRLHAQEYAAGFKGKKLSSKIIPHQTIPHIRQQFPRKPICRYHLPNRTSQTPQFVRTFPKMGVGNQKNGPTQMSIDWGSEDSIDFRRPRLCHDIRLLP